MKRIFEITFVLLTAFIWVPLSLCLAIVCRVILGSPVLFRQNRPGIHGKPFMLYKFRTMSDEQYDGEKLLCDSDRLTPFGEFLRKTSLDELPELWNVLKGDMSLVGPRPLLMEYLDRYTPDEARRHEIKPGITGWAQVNGRTAITFAERFKFDVWYVDNRSFWLDMKILLMTVWKSLACEGIHERGQPQEVFKGIKDL